MSRLSSQLAYRDAWAIQEQTHEQVQAKPKNRLSRRASAGDHLWPSAPWRLIENLLATPEQLEDPDRGVEIVQSDRGGDITFHGPGQLVAYPIIRLADHRLSVGGYVHTLEAAVIAMYLAENRNIAANADPAAVGVWTPDGGVPSKICAIGVRIRRGVSLHGIAARTSYVTDLSYFDLIVPCGLPGRRVTSLQHPASYANTDDH